MLAHAETFNNTTVIPNDHSWIVVNYCSSSNGEEAIFLTGGTIYETLTFTVDGAGGFHLSFRERWSHVVGIGQTTNQPYSFVDGSHIRQLATDTFTDRFTTTSKLMMNGPFGRAMTVHATFGYHVDPLKGFTITRDRFEVVCK